MLLVLLSYMFILWLGCWVFCGPCLCVCVYACVLAWIFSFCACAHPPFIPAHLTQPQLTNGLQNTGDKWEGSKYLSFVLFLSFLSVLDAGAGPEGITRVREN